jgi:hypothetical protein
MLWSAEDETFLGRCSDHLGLELRYAKGRLHTEDSFGNFEFCETFSKKANKFNK